MQQAWQKVWAPWRQRLVGFRDEIDEQGRKLAPCPHGEPVLGHLRGLRGKRISYITRSFIEHGDIVRFCVPNMTIHLLAHPDHVQYVLLEASRKYTKQTKGYDNLRVFLGDGLLTSEGSFWLRQRRIAQPAFHKRRIEGFINVMSHASEVMCQDWQRWKDTGSHVDMAAEMMKITLRIAGETLLSTDPSDHANSVSSALTTVLYEANYRMNRLLVLPPSVPTPRQKRYEQAATTLDQLVLNIIEQRRSGQENRDDLLQMLLDARDDQTGEGMTNKQLRDEVMTIFLAGHETTANAMAWTLYLLSLHPNIAQKVQKEAQDVVGQGPVTIEHLSKFDWIKRVINEAMRLYPPAWIFGRSPSEDDTIDGYHIPKRSLLFLSPYVTHRHPKFWENPEGFDPDRWLPERVAKMHRYQYFPFSSGPRMCIGNNFALMEAQVILATIAKNYQLSLVSGQVVEPEPVVTLRPKNGLKMTIHGVPIQTAKSVQNLPTSQPLVE
jgi:cytochrome P450